MPYKDPAKQKAAQAAHYQSTKELKDSRQRDRRNAIRKFLDEYKEGKPCTDCGTVYPRYVLDFDHLPDFDKKLNLGSVSSAPSLAAVIEEIAKCEIVCANCHRVRTHSRSKTTQ